MLAKATGKDFAQVLKDMMMQIGGTVAELHSSSATVKASPESPPVTETQTGLRQLPGPSTISSNPMPPPQTKPSLSSCSASDLIPPDVQRYVIEHIVKR